MKMNRMNARVKPIPSAQQGSVLLVALVFLVLTSLIAITTMNTSVLEVRMAGNHQFKEDAMQVAEGISDDIMRHHDSANGETLPLFTSTQKGDLFCDILSTAPECTYKTLYITSDALKAAIGPAQVDYTAEFMDEKDAGRSSTANAGNNLYSYFKLDVYYNGASAGLAQTHMSFGLEKIVFVGDNVVVSPTGANGEDLGKYRFF